jgi:hypothetical protein
MQAIDLILFIDDAISQEICIEAWVACRSKPPRHDGGGQVGSLPCTSGLRSKPQGSRTDLSKTRVNGKSVMRIGATLLLIAVGAILRFALITVVSHGLYLHTIGDILMIVGVVGLILWVVVWSPWTRRRTTTARQYTSSDHGYSHRPGAPGQPGTYVREERKYEDQYPS